MRTSEFNNNLEWELPKNDLSLDFLNTQNQQMYASYSNQLIPLYESSAEKICKPEPNHHFTLADTYLAYDMRESYLQRQAATLI